METEADASEIVPRLWLGNEVASQDINFLTKHQICAVVNATRHIPNTFEYAIAYYRVPVNDPGPSYSATIDQEDNAEMFRHLSAVFDFISRNMQRGSVLVHCHAGIQRSATIVLLFLASRITTSTRPIDKLESSLRHLLIRRPVVFYHGSHASFRPVITEFLLSG